MNNEKIAEELVRMAEELTARRDDPDYDVSRDWAHMGVGDGLEYVNKKERGYRVMVMLDTGRWTLYKSDSTVNAGRLRDITPEKVLTLLKQITKLYRPGEDPMEKEKLSKLYIRLHKWATKKILSLPSTAPVAAQIMENVNTVEKRLKGKGNLRGEAAVEAMIKAMAGLFTVEAAPLKGLWRKYGKPVEELLYEYRILP